MVSAAVLTVVALAVNVFVATASAAT